MQYRTIGNTDINASVVAFGAWAIGGWMWGGVEEQEAVGAIHAGIDHGINLIDTAPMYGYGRSEEIVGKAIKGRRDSLVLATKCGLRWDKADWPDGKGELHFYADENGATPGGAGHYRIYKYLRPESIREEVEQSLRRLGTDRIDVLQTHWQDATTPLDDTIDALLTLKKEGKILAVGCSNVRPDQLQTYCRDKTLDVDQEKFSLLDREAESNGILETCGKNNVSFFAYSPLANGLLTGKLNPNRRYNPGDLRLSRARFTPENVAKVNAALARLTPIAETHRLDIGQVVVAWTVGKYPKMHALCGARNAEQAVRNAVAGAATLSKEETEEIDNLFS
ncbi:MAG TPA: aldo/keto reductase [Planctomycetaceae bacterium]|nr:aldo/keto reductase [Planctomycetaceae bacterium]